MFLLSLMLLSDSHLWADDGPKTFKVVGLTITHPTSKAAGDPDDAFNPGTYIDLVIHLPGKRLLELDARASKLTRFTDDQKTDLSKSDLLGWLTDVHSGVSDKWDTAGLSVTQSSCTSGRCNPVAVQGYYCC